MLLRVQSDGPGVPRSALRCCLPHSAVRWPAWAWDTVGGFPKARARRTRVLSPAYDPSPRHFSEKPAAVISAASAPSGMGLLHFILLHLFYWNIQRNGHGDFRISMKTVFMAGHSCIRFLHSCFYRLWKYVLTVLAGDGW